jgi:hypothetical protein
VRLGSSLRSLRSRLLRLRQRPAIPMSGSTSIPLSTHMAHKVRIFDRHWHLPRSKPIRIGLGILLIAGGLLGFLPVLGFWMIPLGLLVLSVDIPIVRRWRRQLAVWWHRDRKSDTADVPTPVDAQAQGELTRIGGVGSGENWRPRPESNRCTRICSPLRHHSATWPVSSVY